MSLSAANRTLHRIFTFGPWPEESELSTVKGKVPGQSGTEWGWWGWGYRHLKAESDGGVCS